MKSFSSAVQLLATSCGLITLLLVPAPVRAVVVQIDYILESGVAEFDPISVPNPNGGDDIVITPSINITSGSFSAQVPSDETGLIGDGDTRIMGVQFLGEIAIVLSSTVDVLGFPVPVSATLAGPLNGTQSDDGEGILTNLTLFTDTTPGIYDIQAGPLDCTDTAFGAFCLAIEGLLGLEFPITPVAADGTPIPFTGGTFSDLNSTQSGQANDSTFSASLDFSIPIDDTISFGTAIDFLWVEEERSLPIPEPSAMMMLVAASVGAFLRRRRR